MNKLHPLNSAKRKQEKWNSPTNFDLTVLSTLQQVQVAPGWPHGSCFFWEATLSTCLVTGDRLCRGQGVKNQRRWGETSPPNNSELQGSYWTISE